MKAGMKKATADETDIELLERDDPMQRMPFLGTGSKVGRTVGSRFFNYGRHFRKVGVFMVVLIIFVLVFDTWGDAFLDWVHADLDDALTPDRDHGQPLHVLIPATEKNVNLCKTTLGLNVLGYPDPTFLGWDQSYNDQNMVDGGARIHSKITQALSYVNTLKNDKDLVLIADGFDTWFQLPVETLRKRFFSILTIRNNDMRFRYGRRAIRREVLKDHVVFAAGKTCTPNGLHTIACYPIKDPPLNRTMYGNNTDSSVGTTKHSSYRPRYLDAAFMMGHVKYVRSVLERAHELMEKLPETESVNTPYASTGGTSDSKGGKPAAHLYHGDPQSIFARIYGQQEFQREVIRLRYRSWFKKWSPPHTRGYLEGRRFPDILKPPFPHEKMRRLKGHPMEYGITLDYAGYIGSSTADSERDFKALTFDGSWHRDSIPHRNEFDCKPKLKPKLPDDITSAPLPKVASAHGGPSSWSAANKLLGNMCSGNVPVLVHHNGEKKLRGLGEWWSKVWYQKHAREMILNLDEKNHDGPDATQERKAGVGAWTERGEWMGWRHICPQEYDQEIFGESLQ